MQWEWFSILKSYLFLCEATFHVYWRVNRHNVRIWGSENPHHGMKFFRYYSKGNGRCGLLHDQIICPFFFVEKTVTKVYLDMLEQFAFPQLHHLHPSINFQRDGAPPYWSLQVKDTLNVTFQRGGLEVMSQYYGLLVHQTLLPLTYFYGAMLKIKFLP